MLKKDRERTLLGLRLLGEAARRPDLEAAREGVWIPVSGPSMLPWIPNGSEVRVVPSRVQMRLGDIVVVLLQGEIVLHRVVGRSGPLLRTKGDSSHLSDPPLWSTLDVHGVAQEMRQGGRTLSFESHLARLVSRAVALASGFLGLMASLLPRAIFSSPGLPPRALRFGLKLANRVVPYLGLLLLLPLRETAGPRSPGTGLADPPEGD